DRGDRSGIGTGRGAVCVHSAGGHPHAAAGRNGRQPGCGGDGAGDRLRLLAHRRAPGGADEPGRGLRGLRARRRSAAGVVSGPRLKRVLAALLLCAATACGLLPVPRLVFDTPQPPTPSGPPATPLPAGSITFKVQVPPGTPAGSAPAVRLLDMVGGSSRTVVLANTGENVWSGGATAPVGAVLRYEYIRPLPGLVEETRANQQPVRFRLFVVAAG